MSKRNRAPRGQGDTPPLRFFAEEAGVPLSVFDNLPVEIVQALEAAAERDARAACARMQAERERECAWRNDFLDIPLPGTRPQLLAECQRLRRELDEPSAAAGLTVAHAPEVVERLWKAMRRTGGAVPPWPRLSDCSEAAAFADRLLGRERLEALHQAIDAAAAWCEGRGGADPTGEGQQPRNPTAQAVLTIIRAQPAGNGIPGKSIIKKLADQGICIEESTLRRQIIPVLKKHYGVNNLRSRGGYFDARQI